jgi:hypothetical protein
MVVLHYMEGPANVHQTKEHAYGCGAELTLSVRANQHSAKANLIAVQVTYGRSWARACATGRCFSSALLVGAEVAQMLDTVHV